MLLLLFFLMLCNIIAYKKVKTDVESEGVFGMITISLDEYGNFEGEEQKPLFIAGLLFDDGEKIGESHREEWTERERIRSYYKKVMEDAGKGFSYPQDLHSNGDGMRDHKVVGPVKTKVAETLPEFISKGTYQGKPFYDENGRKIRERKGKYHLFVIMKSDEGKKRLLNERASMLAKDNWAANLYFHMAGTVVNRIIFHNPLYGQGQMPSINIDIATRSTGNVIDMNSDLAEEFKKQGYRLREGNSSDYRFYSIMNADIYRTLIAQEMMNSGNISIKIEKMYVKSIQYDGERPMMEFLYLSDSLCSMLGYRLTGSSADEWLEQMKERVETINPQWENLIFGYDEIDNDFTSAWRQYEQKNFYEALSIAYDGKRKTGVFADHYREQWFPYLEKRIRESVTPELFTKSVNELSSMVTINNLDQEKLLYLMCQFEDMAELVADKYRSTDMKARTLYKLYDTGVSAFCHIGNVGKALEYYEMCKKYAFYVGVDAYLRTNNKLVVCLEDCFEWNRALELALENLSSQQMVSEIKREILKKDSEEDFLDEAKAMSQLARIYAEKRDENAEFYFRKALKMLEAGSANYKITQSYLLHYYADQNKQAEFDRELADYFDGKNTWNQCLRYITNSDESVHSVFSNEYAICVLLRGICYFHWEEIDEGAWKKLCTLDELLTKKHGKAPGGHPWELTYKYLEMLAVRRKDEKARKKFIQLRKSCLCYRGEIIEALEQFGEAEVAALEKQNEIRDALTEKLAGYMKEHFEAFKDTIFSMDGDLRYGELQSLFTFMYR